MHEVDLAIAEGEFFSLLGPSGCGKTTSLRMIAGFERPTRGRILLDGADVSSVPPYRRNVNTVFQHYALFPHLSVHDNVAFGLRSARVRPAEIRRRVAEMLEVVHLADLAARKPAQLSGGQQQRVALARALVNRPRALLLDEPLGALDLKLREAMQVELKRIQRETGSTFVYVTHDQFEALTMSDRIAVMHQGRTEQIGTPRDIYDRPASAFVAGFIGTANLLPAIVTGHDGERVRLDVAGIGPLSAPAPDHPVAAGTAVLLVVRPERITVTPEPDDGTPEPDGGTRPGGDGPAGVVATVTEVLFAGATLRCTARTDGGADLVADLVAGTVAGTSGSVRPGGRYLLSWPEDGVATVATPAPADPLETAS